MIRRTTLILGVTLLAAVWLGAGAAAPARASSQDDAMREAVMALRGLIDRQGAAHFFEYPTSREVRDGGGLSSWWPADPWTGRPLSPGTGPGHYRYTTTRDRRHYRLVGFLGGGRTVVVSGGMPREIVLAYDHRSEEGINLIRQYIEDYAAAHHGLYPAPADVAAGGAVGMEPARRYWPSNPWDHAMMAQRGDHGSFSYSVSPDRLSYTLSLHRALKHDYVLGGARTASPWQVLLTKPRGPDPAPGRPHPLGLRRGVGAAARRRAAGGDGARAGRRRRRRPPRLARRPGQRRRDATRARPPATTPTRRDPAPPTDSPSISTPATCAPAASCRRPHRRGATPARRSPDLMGGTLMTRRLIATVLAAAVLALLLAAAAPRAEAISFVDKQVLAGALLIQKYINDYGQPTISSIRR